ncbi:MAG TPA: 3-deoxy-7-phosphoheptulonate synthase, partial [Burkholderiaceae bacterium]|nr:3-deoxy-7-phosphoheptulonate synthase [Burkholderiaceae bacterium]
GKAPNYSPEDVQATAQGLSEAGLAPRIMIDVSHANSNKDYSRQPIVADNLAIQIEQGDERIFGVMIESNLVGGRQDLVSDQPLVYGQSITDGCIDWDASVKVLERLAGAVRARRQRRERAA